MSSQRTRAGIARRISGLLCLVSAFLLLGSSRAQSQTAQEANRTAGMMPAGIAAVDPQQASSSSSGQITGTIVDQTGALAVGARLQLTHPNGEQPQEAVSGDDGQFSFSNVPPGAFKIDITAPGFENKSVTGTLNAAQTYIVPQIVLPIAATTTEVKVGLAPDEVAEVQVKEQEKQRVLGFIPNFYASYVPNAAPLPTNLKFRLAWRSVTDPISILGVGMLAGIYQASDQLNGYGQGAAGYGRRFGAVYGDVFIGTFIDSAILPTVFKQDPRYFYKGTGTKKSRLVYALENAVICRGDDGKREVNYSAIVGSFITSGISQTYYPASDRGVGLYFQTALIRIAEGSVAGIFQEFVVPKLTPRLKKHPPGAQP